MARYEIWYADQYGNRLELMDDTLGFDYVLVDGDIGWLHVNMPYVRGRLHTRPLVDQRIQVYRAPDGGRLEFMATGFNRRWKQMMDASGAVAMQLGAADPNELAARRIAAYYDRTNYTVKDGPAGDIIRDIARENLGPSATDTARDMSSLGVSVQANLGDGPELYHAFAHANLLNAFQEIQQMSKAAGDEVFWRMHPDTPNSYILQVRTGQPGADRTFSTGVNPLYFGDHFGNVTNANLDFIGDDEENFIYAGGPGDGVLQIIKSASDADAIAASAFNRREGYVAATNVEFEYEVEDAALAGLSRKRRRYLFTADILSTPLAPFGGVGGWGMGDKITVSFLGQQTDAIIRMVKVSVENNGRETISARVEGVWGQTGNGGEEEEGGG